MYYTTDSFVTHNNSRRYIATKVEATSNFLLHRCISTITCNSSYSFDNEILPAVEIKTTTDAQPGSLALLSCHLLFSERSSVVTLNHHKPH